MRATRSRHRARSLLIAAAVAAPLAGCGGTSSVRLYVGDRSADSGCTDSRGVADVGPRTPVCTLKRAVELATPGSRIVVEPGSYPRLDVSGRHPSKPVTIESAEPRRATLAGISAQGSSNFRIEGFRVRDTVELVDVSQLALAGNDVSPNDVTLDTAHGIVLEGNRIHDLTIARRPGPGGCVPRRCGYGVRINYVDGVLVRGNTFQRIPADGVQGLDLNHVRIEGNRFDSISPSIDPTIHSDSIQVVGPGTGLTIARNTFTAARGPILQDGVKRGVVIGRNLLVNVPAWAMNLMQVPGVVLTGNTVWRSGSHGVTLLATQGAVATNNIFDRLHAQPGTFAKEDYNLIVSGPRTGRHDVRGAPLFRDQKRMDFRLTRRSPGVRAGTGNRDIGAFQSSG